MKVGIFAFPRTSSTTLGHRISRSINQPFFEEPLTDRHTLEDKHEYIQTVLNPATCGIFKFMNHNFTQMKWQMVDWKSFNKIIFIERRNITQACVSCYIALTNNVWQYWNGKPHKKVKCDEIPRQFVNSFIIDINMYFNIKQELKKITDGITIFYEDSATYSTEVMEYLDIPNLAANGPFEASNLDYQKICTNYHEVDEWVKSDKNLGINDFTK